MYTRLLLVVFLFITMLLPGFAPAQNWQTGIIQGTVTDSLTGHTLENTNVYLASTSLGTSTDATGSYVLKGVPIGTHQLVFSRVGSFPRVLTIHMDRPEALRQDVQLHMRSIELRDIEVTGEKEREWGIHLREFKLAFLGETRNAEQSKLINPEVVTFRFNDKDNSLSASTESPLVFDNNGLGFRVTVEIVDFHWDVKQGFGYYLTYPYFQDLRPSTSADSSKWMDSRRKAYVGSLQHFLKALYNCTLAGEGFFVFRCQNQDAERERGKYISPEDLNLAQDRTTSAKRWTFDGWLRVDHHGPEGRVSSFIHLIEPEAIIEPSGILRNPLAAKVLGHWRDARMADMLPTNAALK